MIYNISDQLLKIEIFACSVKVSISSGTSVCPPGRAVPAGPEAYCSHRKFVKWKVLQMPFPIF